MNATLARLTMFASFGVSSLAGIAFLLAFWIPTDLATALVRSALFATAMAVVHWTGYGLYLAQDTHPMVFRNVDFSHVRPHFSVVALTQLPCLLLAALLLDGGKGLRICITAVFAHWLAITFISARDRSELTWMDNCLSRWGFIPCLVCTALIGNMIW